MEQRSEQFKQFSCECGKQFSTRSELEKHREGCATAQASGGMETSERSSGPGEKVRGMGGSSTTGK